MSKIFLAISILIATSAYAQITISKQPILLGKCDKESLLQTPYIDWFQEAYNNYKPGPEAKKLSDPDLFKNCTMEIFFGSWCGDSKREVPHFLKLLHEISFPMEKVQMIAVGNRDTLLKQSPGHEEEGKGIFRVPTFIIYKNEEEINRITEFPVNSLEQDLLDIVSGYSYQPNYHSFGLIRNWLNNGTFSNENLSYRSMAGQLGQLVRDEHELNSLAHVLLRQGKKKEALKIFQSNNYLFSETAIVAESLGEAYLKNDFYSSAVFYLERSLRLNRDPEKLKGILDLLYEAKSKEKS
ncbi:MAG TPA: hypothetical protein PLU37_10760 [Chitinophagaceae bacterium]|nr:hypothetical protein [Chitinophagaceae bacterium]HPG12003.1 hypothetical protein [Chitinophagaceae bacterium]